MGLSWIECCSKHRLVIHFIIGQFPASRRSGKIRWDWHQSIISRSLSLVIGHPKKCDPWCQNQISRAWIYICVVSLLWVLLRIHALHAGFWCQMSHIQYIQRNMHTFLLCCGYTLTDFPISIRLTSLALWQSNDCPSASKATLMNMDKYFMWIHYERLHNHNKAKHNKTVCIFLGIYCMHMFADLLLYFVLAWHRLMSTNIFKHYLNWAILECANQATIDYWIWE